MHTFDPSRDCKRSSRVTAKPQLKNFRTDQSYDRNRFGPSGLLRRCCAACARTLAAAAAAIVAAAECWVRQLECACEWDRTAFAVPLRPISSHRFSWKFRVLLAVCVCVVLSRFGTAIPERPLSGRDRSQQYEKDISRVKSHRSQQTPPQSPRAAQARVCALCCVLVLAAGCVRVRC